MSKKITYTTDVSHCMGRACAIRDKCYRYWLRKEQCKKAVDGFLHPCHIAPFVEEQYDFETEECEMFKELQAKSFP